MIKWIAAAMLTVAVAASTFELSCVASERPTESPSASAPAYSYSMGPDLPGGSELEDLAASPVPVLTR